MGLRVIGGERGTIAPLREQALRLASCHFTLEWDGDNGTRGGLRRFRIASGMESIGEAGGRWPEAVELSQEFRDHLRSIAGRVGGPNPPGRVSNLFIVALQKVLPMRQGKFVFTNAPFFHRSQQSHGPFVPAQ